MKQYLLPFTMLVLSSFFYSCGNAESTEQAPMSPPLSQEKVEERTCIQRIMAYDEKLGTIRNHGCETQSLSKTIQDYVNALENASFKGCPNTFKDAFDKHIEAWKATLVVTDKHPDLRGEMHDLFDELEKHEEDGAALTQAIKGIWDTWEEVEKAKEIDRMNSNG